MKAVEVVFNSKSSFFSDTTCCIIIFCFCRLLDEELVRSVKSRDLLSLMSVLRAYDCCGRRDAALVVFIAEFLECRLRASLANSKKDPLTALNSLFSSAKSLWEAEERELIAASGVFSSYCRSKENRFAEYSKDG